MRLIDYDKLHEQALDIIGADASHKAWAILSAIDNAPTIELPERKRGRWEIYVISMLDGEGCRCSECGFEGVPYWNFCPNCGAEMEASND